MERGVVSEREGLARRARDRAHFPPFLPTHPQQYGSPLDTYQSHGGRTTTIKTQKAKPVEESEDEDEEEEVSFGREGKEAT